MGSTPEQHLAASTERLDRIDGLADRIPDELRIELPDVLWLYHMGLILFWVQDHSPDQMATRLAIARTVPLIVRVIMLADVPELRATMDDLIGLMTDVRTLRS